MLYQLNFYFSLFGSRCMITLTHMATYRGQYMRFGDVVFFHVFSVFPFGSKTKVENGGSASHRSTSQRLLNLNQKLRR